MNFMLKQIIRTRIMQLTPGELIRHAHAYNIDLSLNQANQIINVLRESDLDPFSKADLNKLFDRLEQITDASTAEKGREILTQFVKQYGVADWFE
ncbi:Protein of unknown function [Amphibacillus marinus]|uniref:DUF2624 domain-containing protein n=1 Tax=Amphibacillus marinus TaxID=872970 RepID=A0A1H8HHV1_9BACI|nr:DUF2624 domain-containing protein [Amphibacillus marinus]SEN55537.1 Protein of unknown function [Amphibacillus marinus]